MRLHPEMADVVVVVVSPIGEDEISIPPPPSSPALSLLSASYSDSSKRRE
jgi:hypothetical protein